MSREMISAIARDFNKNMCSDREVLESCTECAGSIENSPCLLYEIATRIYKAGYRKQEWISVEERLPERMKPVLVLATGRYEEDGYDVLIAYHDGGEWEEQCVHSHECCVFYIYADVKFWMPLPEPPKGDHHE